MALLSLLLAAQLSAADSVFTTPVDPVVTKTKGQPVTSVWPDGREAEIQVNLNDPIDLPLPFDVTVTVKILRVHACVVPSSRMRAAATLASRNALAAVRAFHAL